MKRILVLNFFPAFVPPSSGGELRYFHLYSQLSRYFDITLLSPTYSHHAEEVVTHSSTFREYRIPKGPLHDRLHQQVDREALGPEVSALVCALSARFANQYHRAYLQLYRDAEIIIHEFPYMLEYDLFFGLDDKPRIYSSHNLESSLVQQVWGGTNADKYVRFIRSLEERLIARSDLCFAVSEEERERFIAELGGDGTRIFVAPNGIHPNQYPRAARNCSVPADSAARRPSVLFFGSHHPPNIAAAQFISNELAVQCPRIDFHIAGNCLDGSAASAGGNVHVLGKVSEERKRELLATADIAINPMFAGAGTHLKVLEFMAAGIPLVATATGVRGLGLDPDEHFVLADRNNFADRLLALVNDQDRQSRLAERAKAFVNARYSWEAIAAQVKDRIESCCSSKAPAHPRTLLVLNDFEVHSPTAGGEIRIHRLYSDLAEYGRVILLCLNSRGGIRATWIRGSFLQLSVPKTEEHLQLEQKTNVRSRISATDLVTYQCVEQNPWVAEVCQALTKLCEVVVLSHPYMVKALHNLPGKPVIYESHNCEHELKKWSLRERPDCGKLVELAQQCESEALDRARFVISVSDHDHPALHRLTGGRKAIYTVSNGVDWLERPLGADDLPHLKTLFEGCPVILFVGSGHQPNLDALAFIKDRLAPAMPDCMFLVIGTVCDAFVEGIPANLLLCGKVPESHKEILMGLADVAINPMTSGSGSNLKLSEYLVKGIPVVTTPFGVRGYTIRHGEEALVCELEQFPSTLRALLGNQELRQHLIACGRLLVQTSLDWKVLAKRYWDIVREEIFEPAQKRLLVVTYRFTDPPLGGAEAFLLELLREVHRKGRFRIDVATLDILTIQNQYHFASRYSYDGHAAIPPDLPGTRVFRFKTDCISEQTLLNHARALFRQWMQESRQVSLQWLPKYEAPLLMGGWYYPEMTGNGYEIWSSEEALIFVRGMTSLVLRGHSPRRTPLVISADGEELHRNTILGDFDIGLQLQGQEVLVLRTERPFMVGDDPRTLGLRIRSIDGQTGENHQSLRLDDDYKSYLKTRFPADYIGELINTAETRPSELDELFQKTRGPNSTELETWLDRHITEYDAVLGHSVPFATSVLAARYARKHSKRLILVPHFHIDDEFYHWKSYYDALRQADQVIAHPQSAIPLFFARLGCNSTYLPYGIHLPEVDPVEGDIAFQRLCPWTLPFVLVLGRKDRSKNYQLVIEAVRRLNSLERRCHLVMIGRDEDGVSIHPEEALYLGEQPDTIVRAALRRALCLISMSTSESFGIVILESWAEKRPVIVNQACNASAELVADGLDGLHAGHADLDSKILELLNHPARADQMGQQGFAKVQANYTWPIISERLHAVLDA